MARSGQFGRLPRQAPDLSGAIAALLRESQSQEDQNMVDAWKNGGEVDGEAVTDSKLLAYFKMRRDDMTPGSPSWDEWDNRITQYTFSIDESKQMVKWDNEKVSEADMAKFYSDWLKKTPKNTEFHRHLASQMGKWRAAQRAKGRAGRGGSSAKAYAAWKDNYFRDHAQGAVTFANGIDEVLRRAGALPAGSEGFSTSIVNPDSEYFAMALDIIENGSTDPDVLREIERLTAEIQKTEPGFEWNKADITALQDEAKRASKVFHERAPNKTDREWALKLGEGASIVSGNIQDLGVLARATQVTEDFKTRWDDCAGEVVCQRRALISAENGLANIGGQLSADNTDTFWADVIANTRRQIEDAAAGRPAQAGQGANVFTVTGGQTDPLSGDGLSVQLDTMNQAAEWQKTGGFVTYVTDENGRMVQRTNPPGAPVPAGAVPIFSLVTATVDVTPDGHPTQRGPGTGQAKLPVTVYAPMVPVSGVELDPVTGEPTGEPGPPLFHQVNYIGYDGKQKTVYRTVSADGKDIVYTIDPPQYEGATLSDAGGQAVMVFDSTKGGAQKTTETDGVTTISGAKVTGGNYVEGGSPHITTGGGRVFGSYSTIEGGIAGQAMEQAYYMSGATGKNVQPGMERNRSTIEASRALSQLIGARDAAAAKGMPTDDYDSDVRAGLQTFKLLQAGLTGKTLTNSLNARLSISDENEEYAKALEASGFAIAGSPQGRDLGIDEFTRRVDLLAMLDQREQALNPAGAASPFASIYKSMDPSGRYASMQGAKTSAEQAAIDAAQARLLGGKGGVAAFIKVPGMANPFASQEVYGPPAYPGQVIGQAGGGIPLGSPGNPFGMPGGVAGIPGLAPPAGAKVTVPGTGMTGHPTTRTTSPTGQTTSTGYTGYTGFTLPTLSPTRPIPHGELEQEDDFDYGQPGGYDQTKATIGYGGHAPGRGPLVY